MQITFFYKALNILCYAFQMPVVLQPQKLPVKPVLIGHSKKTKNWFSRYRLMQVKNITECSVQVKNIAECSNGAFCNIFDLHLATIFFMSFVLSILSGRLRQVSLYVKTK